jgi:hypothetical protein
MRCKDFSAQGVETYVKPENSAADRQISPKFILYSELAL